MNCRGIDLHSNNSVVSVIDETHRVVAEKRLPNNLERIQAFLAPWRAELAGVVVESTYNWYWLVDGLQAAGFVVHLARTSGSVSRPAAACRFAARRSLCPTAPQ
jgi:transposase